MRRLVVRPSRQRCIFFRVDGTLFLNLLFNHSDALQVTEADIAALLSTHDPDDLVIGRRLTRREAAEMSPILGDAEAEAFARLIPDRKDRWTGRTRRRR